MGRISMPQGRGSQMHNRRDYRRYGKAIPDNIDASLTAHNVTLADEDARNAYSRIFGDAVDRYNAKQKRDDRKITDYYDHVCKSKNGEKPFYEDVIQWGTMEDFQAHPELRDTAIQALKEYAGTFERRNPNLRLIGAYIHADEASPHMHIDYIPVAHGYKRGMDTRNSLDRAMKEMGIAPMGAESKKNNATRAWKERERAYFGGICQKLGLDVEEERHDYGRESLSPAEFGRMKDTMRQELLADVMAEKKRLENENAELKGKIKALKGEINAAIATKRRMDDIRDVKPEPVMSLLGKEVAVKGVRVDDVEGLKKQALKAIALESRVHSLEKENARLNKLIPSIDDRRRQAAERKELARYRDALDMMPPIVRDAYFPKPEHQQTARREREDSL